MKIALFDPCYLTALRPMDANHARRVLEALGDDVSLIDGRCCGQPAFNSGFRAEAKRVGRELLRVARSHDVVVTPSGSCTSMVKHYLPGLWDGERGERVQTIASRFRELSEHVAAHPRLGDLALRLDGAVAYHDSCHARRELRLSETTLSLLARVRGLEVRRLSYEAECCGFGGTFSVKMPEVSTAMLTSKLDDVRQSGARVLVSTDYSCLAHLEAGARGMGVEMETWTVAELLARSLQ